MKQLDLDFPDGREPTLRDLLHQAGLETSTDIARRQYIARKERKTPPHSAELRVAPDRNCGNLLSHQMIWGGTFVEGLQTSRHLDRRVASAE